MTEFGNIDLIEKRDTGEGGNVKIRLPGVAKGDMAARAFKPEVRVFDISFSPTGNRSYKSNMINPTEKYNLILLQVWHGRRLLLKGC